MKYRALLITLLATGTLLFAGVLPQSSSRADHGTEAETALPGTWAINFIAPVSPKGNNFGQPHRHRFTFSNTDGQKTVFAREVENLRVPGAWRGTGEDFSATFEFTCPDGVTCGTIVMRGRIDSETRLSGRIFIIWDEPDETTPTGLDTVAGTFTGERCSGNNSNSVRPQHDTGGCDGQ